MLSVVSHWRDLTLKTMTMDKQMVIWSVAPLAATIGLLGLANSAAGSLVGIIASGIGGALIVAPAVAVIAGIWYLFSKKRHRLPLVIGWSFLVLSILVLVVSGQASLST